MEDKASTLVYFWVGISKLVSPGPTKIQMGSYLGQSEDLYFKSGLDLVNLLEQIDLAYPSGHPSVSGNEHNVVNQADETTVMKDFLVIFFTEL